MAIFYDLIYFFILLLNFQNIFFVKRMNSLASKFQILKDSSNPTIYYFILFFVSEEFDKTTKREAICFVSPPPLCTNKVVHQSHCRNGFALYCEVILIVRERSSSCNGFWLFKQIHEKWWNHVNIHILHCLLALSHTWDRGIGGGGGDFIFEWVYGLENIKSRLNA